MIQLALGNEHIWSKGMFTLNYELLHKIVVISILGKQ